MTKKTLEEKKKKNCIKTIFTIRLAILGIRSSTRISNSTKVKNLGGEGYCEHGGQTYIQTRDKQSCV